MERVGEEFIDGGDGSPADAQSKFEELRRSGDKSYIAQRRCEHGFAEIPEPIDAPQINWSSLRFILGVYVIDGKGVAIEAKVAKDIPININQRGPRRGYRMPVFSLRH